MFFLSFFYVSQYKPDKKLRYSMLADELIFNISQQVEFGTLVDAAAYHQGLLILLTTSQARMVSTILFLPQRDANGVNSSLKALYSVYSLIFCMILFRPFFFCDNFRRQPLFKQSESRRNLFTFHFLPRLLSVLGRLQMYVGNQSICPNISILCSYSMSTGQSLST